MLISNFLEISSELYPEKKAAFYNNEWKSFSELEILANRIGNYLHSIGVQRGDRVAILYENSFEYIASYYGILKIGAVTVALNTDTNSDMLKYTLTNSDSKVLITNSKYNKHLKLTIPFIPKLTHLLTNSDENSEYENCTVVDLGDILKNGEGKRPDVRCIDIDLASIVYTSGSTGTPKGVSLTHLNVITNTKSIVKYLKLTENDRIMVVLPFYYIYGKSLLNTHFSVGGSVVIDNRFMFPQVVLESMKQNEVTGFSGVPSTFMILLDKSAVRKFSFPKLRYLTQAGGAMAPAVQEKVIDVFDPAKLFVMYGATEASARLSYLEPERLKDKLGSIGKAIPNVDLFVASEDGVKLPPWEKGEIVARGANIMTGYWKDPETTAKILKNGLYYSGDIGVEDEDGFIFVVGRSKDIIKPGGLRVSAKEVEEALLEIDGIFKVAVIGVDDKLLGEAIKAYIVLSDRVELEEETIKKKVALKLPHFKNPKFYEFRRDLPMNKSGKIMKETLKEESKMEVQI